MTSQPGSQTITIHILPNISGSKGNQLMKFSPLIEYIRKKTFLFKTHAENEAWILVRDRILFFKRALFEIRASKLQLSFIIFR